jgi:hypothetical protein
LVSSISKEVTSEDVVAVNVTLLLGRVISLVEVTRFTVGGASDINSI